MKRIPEDAKPHIRYPTRWKYSLIGPNAVELRAAVADVVGERSHKLSTSNVSSRGRYVSLTLELIVLNETERLRIFDALRSHPAVTMVL